MHCAGRIYPVPLLLLWVAATGCPGDAPTADAKAPPEASLADGQSDALDATPICVAGSPLVVGQLCVLGTEVDPGDAGAPADDDAAPPPPLVALVAGQPLRFVVYPKGCYSARCTKVHEERCAVTAAGGALSLEATFCVGPKQGQNCSTDCEGGGAAECATSDPLAAGSYTATVAGISVSFTVPSRVAREQLCGGSRY